MYQSSVSAARSRVNASRLLVLATMLVALALLAWDAQAFLAAAVRAIRYPFELDYGEGIVWQQAEQMRAGNAYGAITGFPAIVFHYPPLYHAITLVASGLSGVDMLMAGRAVSVAATLLTSLFAGMIAFRTARFDADRNAALLCAFVAGFAVLGLSPVGGWGPLMRVDMVAMALGLGGIWCTMLAFERPRAIIFAAACFVAAVYTKQTAIAAPAAAFTTLMLIRPRTALVGISTSFLLGVLVLAPLTWATDGGFERHIFLYNINRFDFSRLGALVGVMSQHAPYLAIVIIALFKLERRHSLFAMGEHRSNANGSGEACVMLLLVYLGFAALMMLTIAKIGSNVNYIIETLCVVAILVGIACRDAAQGVLTRSTLREGDAPIAWMAVPILIAVQGLAAPAPLHAELQGAQLREMNELVAMVHDARRPVISDNMVAVKRAGREVVWEPAIFTELASKGLWDERPFVQRIRDGQFAFFVTVGDRGQRVFDSRYTPAMMDAMDAAYPVRRHLAKFTLHLPRSQAAAK